MSKTEPHGAASRAPARPRDPTSPGGLAERSLAFLLLCFMLVSAWKFGETAVGSDYYQFWVVGRAVGAGEMHALYTDGERAHIGALYWTRARAEAGTRNPALGPPRRFQAAQGRQVLETFSTPWLYTLFGLASGGNYERDLDRFQAASLVCYALAIFALCRVLGYSIVASTLALALSLLWFAPFVDDVRVGNVNRLQLSLLCAAVCIEARMRSAWRHALAGALLGVLVAFKPNIAFVVLALGGAWLVSRQHRRLAQAVLGALAGGAFAFAASSLFFGTSAAWLDWLRAMPGLMQQGEAAEGNYALGSVLHATLGFAQQHTAALFVCALGVLALWLRAAQVGRSSDADRTPAALELDVFALGIGALLSLFAPALVWQHYFVLALPLALYLLRPRLQARAPLVIGLALAGLALIALDALWKIFGWQAAGAALAVNCGALLLLAAALVETLTNRRVPAIAAAR